MLKIHHTRNAVRLAGGFAKPLGMLLGGLAVVTFIGLILTGVL